MSPPPPPRSRFSIHTLDGTLAANPSTVGTSMADKITGEGNVALDIPALMLVPGAYTLGAAILDASGEHAIDRKLRLVRFEVDAGRPGEPRGIVALHGHWSGAPVDPDAR